MNETRLLARFVADTGYEDLPPRVLERGRVYVLDNLTAGFVGSVQPWSLMVAGLARDLGGRNESSIFNHPWRTDASRAALVNGAMIGAFEIEHVGHVSHPSGTVFPAALAVAQRGRMDGKTFLAAMLLGYEVVCRAGEAQTDAVERERGFHNPGVNGTFGAAAAVSKLLKLDEIGTTWALGIAGSHSSGLAEFAWEGAMTKRLHLGRAAQLGLESALLAQKGFTGPTTVLEGRYGYLNAFSPRPRPERLLEGLGRRWLLEDLIIKAYPCHVTGQALVHAIQQFKRCHAIRPAAVERVIITGGPEIIADRFQNREPDTVLGAQYSLPFTVAVALTRDMSDPLVFNEDTLRDPVVKGLAKRIEVRAHPRRFASERAAAPAAEVVLELDGESHTLATAGFPGSLDQPLDYDGAVDKFRQYATPVIGTRRANRIVGIVRDLDALADITQLIRLVAVSRRASLSSDGATL